MKGRNQSDNQSTGRRIWQPVQQWLEKGRQIAGKLATKWSNAVVVCWKKAALAIRPAMHQVYAHVAVPRVLAFSVTGLLLVVTLFSMLPLDHTYLVQADGKLRAVQTVRSGDDHVLATAGVSLESHDLLEQVSGGVGIGKMSVLRAYTVAVKVDGETKNVILAKGSVSDVLRLANVTLSAQDYVSAELTSPSQPKMEIVVNRVDYQERVVTKEISYKTTTTKTYALGVGNSKVVSMGIPGQQKLVYKDKLVDGKVVSSELLKTTTVKQPVNQVVATGLSPRQPISLIEPPADFALNANGVPTKYTKVIRQGVATAYSARAGSLTASGRRAYQGTVAVNPKVIPYGTKLYIVSSDHRYVYGYAIAADTGTGLMKGWLDVDLFFNTYEDSCNWGVKKVDIYLLG